MAQGVSASVSSMQRNDARVVRVGKSQRASLRRQTLEVLDLEHHRFDSFADRTVAEQIRAATIFRDAFDVLDAIGWKARRRERRVDEPLTAGHVAQLDARRKDLALAIVDRVNARDELPAPGEIASMHADNLIDRAILRDLAAVITAYHHANRA
jgi:hypothetical protein